MVGKTLRRKRRLKLVRTEQMGTSPGSLVFGGEQKLAQVKVRLVDYGPEHFKETDIKRIEECFTYRDSQSATWISICGLHDTELLQKFGVHYGIHPLILEDILNTTQRSKFEDHGDKVFITARAAIFDQQKQELNFEQLSLIVGPKFLISFHESDDAFLAPVLERIRNGSGRIRKLGTNYLAYRLLDRIVDGYFATVSQMEQRIQILDDILVGSVDPKVEEMQQAHLLKREILLLRSVVLPVCEVCADLLQSDNGIINENIEIYLRDLYDHAMKINDTIDTAREILDGMIDIYLSGLSFKMNEIMKVFTVMTSIFIPLTFLASIYGMNFKHMPELESPFSYPILLALMAVIAGVLLMYFRRKRWF